MQQNSRFLGIVFLFSLLASGIIGGAVVTTYRDWSQNLPLSLRRFLPQNNASSLNNTRVVVTNEESAVTSVVEKSSPSVVSIVAKTTNFDPFTGPVSSQQGIGTGFIIDKNGTILTNSHVVEDDTLQYTVLTKDKKNLTVKKIEKDPTNDIAILTVDGGGNLPSLPLGNSDSIKVGQSVIAIGNALGRFDNTVTVGVISGIGRGITASGSSGSNPETIDNVLQTDAALNPGNSGGPLLDLGGNVIGVNFATTSGAQNIGFVIPINTTKPVIDGFNKTGRIIRAYLGVGYQFIDETIANLRKLPQGAFIQRVVNASPADKAGIIQGDIITKIGGQDLDSSHTLAGEISKHKVGEEVEVVVFRDNKNKTLKVRLEETPATPSQ